MKLSRLYADFVIPETAAYPGMPEEPGEGFGLPSGEEEFDPNVPGWRRLVLSRACLI